MIGEIGVESKERCELIELGKELDNILKDSGIKDGIMVVFIPHTTAGITINENADPDVKKDILWKLGESIPKNEGYKHSEGNSDAHLKSSLIGASETLIIKNGKLILGTWQNVYFAEFDGPRSRKVFVKIIGD